jgi:hypothetical protein
MRLRFVATAAFASGLAALLPGSAFADFLSVPADYPTIQAAIDAAPEGAVVSVAPGRYVENIDFLGKAIVVDGAGPDSVIDGGGKGSVVRMVNGEGASSVLDSFTITGGLANNGGGIEIQDSSPTILRNVIAGNSASGAGSGMYIGGASSAPRILNNLMIFNTGVDGGDPHTVQVAGSSPHIINNTIVRNDSNAIITLGVAAPEIRNNVLARNGTRYPGGGAKGRGICDFATGTVTQFNLFFRNARAALLTSGTDFRLIRRAQAALLLDRLANNIDAAPRFEGGPLPRTLEAATPERFVPSADPLDPSRALNAGDPAPAYDNLDGSRNTIGFTGGSYPLTY